MVQKPTTKRPPSKSTKPKGSGPKSKSTSPKSKTKAKGKDKNKGSSSPKFFISDDVAKGINAHNEEIQERLENLELSNNEIARQTGVTATQVGKLRKGEFGDVKMSTLFRLYGLVGAEVVFD